MILSALCGGMGASVGSSLVRKRTSSIRSNVWPATMADVLCTRNATWWMRCTLPCDVPFWAPRSMRRVRNRAVNGSPYWTFVADLSRVTTPAVTTFGACAAPSTSRCTVCPSRCAAGTVVVATPSYVRPQSTKNASSMSSPSSNIFSMYSIVRKVAPSIVLLTTIHRSSSRPSGDGITATDSTTAFPAPNDPPRMCRAQPTATLPSAPAGANVMPKSTPSARTAHRIGWGDN